MMIEYFATRPEWPRVYGILFVDGGGEHADRAEEELAVLLGGLFQSWTMNSSMSPAMLLKVSASSLISAAPCTGVRW